MNYVKINTDYLLLSNSKKNKCNQITVIEWTKGNNIRFAQSMCNTFWTVWHSSGNLADQNPKSD